MINRDSCGASSVIRYDWRFEEVKAVYELPLPKLLFLAEGLHRVFHNSDEIQACSLLSIKTGGCPEDCGYCPQSAHHSTGVEREGLLDVDDVMEAARRARAKGATRFCMGAAWREAPTGKEFSHVVEMVRGVRSLGLEACCTLGMLEEWQCVALFDAGLTAYNHNLDTSPEYYPSIIKTRTYKKRLETLERVRRAGIAVCSGGIVGMGESREDRVNFLKQLCSLRPHPESVPINLLTRVSGTPLADAEPLDLFELVRTVATARILMPASVIRLSAGRQELSDEAQLLCFIGGANSIFIGDRLLTTANPSEVDDLKLLKRLGLKFSRNREVPPS